MANLVTDSLKKVVKENIVKKGEFSTVKGYYKAIKMYDELITEGLTKRRGYNLKTIDSKKELVLFNTFL